MSPLTRLCLALSFLIAAGPAAQTGTPAASFVRPDGTLDLAGAPAGALDLAGMNVRMGADGSLRAAAEGDFRNISTGATGFPLDGDVRAMAVAADGTVYVGGYFMAAGGTALNHVARRAAGATVWEPLGTGTDNPVQALAVAGDGSVYAGGEFMTAGGVAASHVARWTGTAWEPLGSGVAGFNVAALAVDRQGDLVLGGSFVSAGGVVSPYIALYDAPAVVTSEGNAGDEARLSLSVSPNPVASGGTVRVTTAEAGPVRVTLYDVLGRQVAVLADGERAAGAHAVALGAERLVPGVYLVRVTAGRASAVGRITVTR